MASRSLYKWKKQESTPAFASRGNVKEWVKQVQKASDDAARDTFGDQSSVLFGKQNVFVDDAVISEAQDLLDSWIQKKKVDDLMAECDLGDVKWSHLPPQHGAVNGIESSRLGSDGTILYDPLYSIYQDDISSEPVKPAFELDVDSDSDEEYAVQEVVHNMLGKDLVNVEKVSANILQSKTKKFKDPTPKMELRHKQVKEKAKERKVAWVNAHQKKITQKLVHQEACKQLDREEKEQQHKIKREEEEIRKEMVRIRKAMQDESKMRTKQRIRDNEEDESANKLAKQEILKQQKEKENQIKSEYAAKAKMKRLLLKQMEEDESKQKQEDLKLLHKCFSSWYAVVMNKRIKIGKARALFDWRHKLRTWNAWRTFVWRSKSDRETRALTQEMKERHRKEALADRCYHQLVCQRCLAAWLSYVWKEKQERKLKEQHDDRASKMASLLKAAASGHFGQKQEENVNTRGSDSVHDLNNDDVEEIFLQPLNRKPVCGFTSKENTGTRSRNNKDTRKRTCAKQAWPHEILRDMKSEKSRHATATKKTSSEPEKQDSQRSTFSKNAPANHVVTSNNHSNSNRKIILEKTPLFLEEQSRATCIFNEKSKPAVELPDRNIVTDRTTSVETPSEISDGRTDRLPTSRSAMSVTSKQSKVTSRKPPTKPLHLAMEERAKARAERKTQMEVKRREAEEQHLAKLKKEQELKEKEIEAEKQAVLQKKREEKRIAKERELEKQNRLEELKVVNQKADNYYSRFLVRNYGLRPWKKLMKDIEDKTRSAVTFRGNRLQRICFHEWLRYTKTQCELRDKLARSFYKKLLLRRGLISWKKYRHHLVEMHHIALEFSKRYLVKKYVRVWQDYVIEERLMYWHKESRADEHNDSRLKQKALRYWKKYIPLLREEEKREKRREDLRKHVQSLLPDFQGIKLNNSQQ